MKNLYFIFASLSLCLAILGIIIPGLPTTPFLLLSACLYAKSSEKLYNWLINHKIYGEMIRNYQETKAISLFTKISSISLMWIMISVSVFCFIENIFVRILLLILGIIGTVVMGFIINTKR